MKRTALLIAVVALIAFLLTWNFGPLADASKDKRRPNETEVAKHDGKASAPESSRARVPTFSRRGKGAATLIGLDRDELTALNGKSAAEADDDQMNDPDLPAFLRGKIDEAEYIRLRDEQVALLRGVEPGKPFDFTARGRAITQMDRQMAELTRAAEKSSGALQPQAFPNWVELGPNPIPNGQTQTTTTAVSGRVSAIEIDPTDPNKVYVGAAQGGVFRSLDGGTTWTPIFDSAQSLAIGALALDAANGRLYVGTGEANGSADSFGGVGLYRIDSVNTTATLVGPINPVRSYNDATTNCSGGPCPQMVPVFNGRSISKILIVPNDPTTLFVGTAGGVMGIGGDAPFGGTIPMLGMRGLYRLSSVTGAPAGVGVTRIGVRSGSGIEGCFDTPCTGNRNINDMVFDPGDATGNTLIVWLNGTSTASDGGIWRSTNAITTASFTQTFSTTSSSTSNGRGALAIYKEGANPAVIYAASGEPSTGGTLCNSPSNAGALRRSVDGGLTWSTKLNGGGGFCDGQCFYNIGLDVLPGATTATTDDKILLGGNVQSTNCQKLQGTSLDGAGTAFSNTDDGLHADTHVIKIAPSNSLIVYRGDDGGIWKSVDGGATWASLNNTTFRATQFQSIAVHPTDPNFSIGGTQDNGTNNLLASGTAWNRIDFGDGGFALIDQNATDLTNVVMYHTYFNQTSNLIGFARVLTTACAMDAQWSFKGRYGGAVDPTVHCDGTTDTFNGITIGDTVNFYAPMALGPNAADSSGTNPVYYGSDRLYRSANRGDTVAVASQAPLTAGVPLSSIAISPQDDNYRIVGLNNGALFFTTTASSTLTSLDPVGGGTVIPDKYVGRVFFDPNNKNTAYVCLGGYMGSVTAADSHVWKITNLNTTPVLTGINGSGITGLPDVPINAFVIDPQQSNRLFVGTDIGVFISEDAGARWSPYGTGLPRVAVFGMAIQNVKRVLRIATHGRGMWEIPLFGPTAAPASISGTVTTPDGAPLAGVTMNLSGARSAKVITDSNGNYRFNNIDTDNFYTVTPSLVNYHFGPESRSFSLLANMTDAVFTATRDAVISGNAIDTPDYFVRQHYLDFLGREPDESGFNFWSDQILSCGSDAECIERRTINVSVAYFLSIEFQETGGLVDGLYRASYGRRPLYAEFMPDTGTVAQNVIVGSGDWAGQLAANKQVFVDAWVQRADFRAAYDGLTNNAFVDALIGHTGASFSGDRDALVAGLNNGSLTRAAVLRQVVENEGFIRAKFNETFVMMEYFGYLRRDPDESGYQFWLNKLNQFGGNFEQAEMVKAFLVSGEYRARFSQ